MSKKSASQFGPWSIAFLLIGLPATIKEQLNERNGQNSEPTIARREQGP